MTTKTAWAHLPNAKHIDAVLADVKARPEAWAAARDAVWGAVWGAALGVVWEAARDAAWDAVQDATRDAARAAVRDAARSAAWAVMGDCVAALIAWDDSADLLECTPDVLRAMIDLAEPPVCHQAVLLLPYAIVRSSDK